MGGWAGGRWRRGRWHLIRQKTASEGFKNFLNGREGLLLPSYLNTVYSSRTPHPVPPTQHPLTPLLSLETEETLGVTQGMWSKKLIVI